MKSPSSGDATWLFAGAADNDLYRAVSAGGTACPRYDIAAAAIAAAQPGAGVLILADGYPDRTTVLEPGLFATAAEKRLRLFIEYPAALPELVVAAPRGTTVERVVVAAAVFGDALPEMQIVAIHDCHYVPVPVERAHLVVAKVAGYDRAVYGLADTPTAPILFEHPGGRLLVATTKLSQFVTARYAPVAAMRAIWNMVFEWLQPGCLPPRLVWVPTVRPTCERSDPLPSGAARSAVQRAVDWHGTAGMLLSEEGWNEYQRRYAVVPPEVVGSLPDARQSGGTGRFGILEGVSSRVRFDGTQPARWWLRSDCNGESALAFALRWKMDGDAHSRTVAAQLLDWTYVHSGLFETDPAKANYGLLYWTPDSRDALYHDNDVKAILGGLGAAGVLGTNQWDEALVTNILANFRTAGIHGFRGQRLSAAQLAAAGWPAYWRADTVMLQPHYEAWIWAAYLWLYDKTRYAPLLERTRHAIRLMMEAYPARWGWTNGFQQERGRMLLPLAWLVRVDDRPEHRAWLARIIGDLARCQDDCGALREELGPLEQGRYRPTPSNAAYGTDEAPLIHANGDPAADLLYTCNFAFLGLHEAYAATGDPECRRVADRLAEFLLRVQIRSEMHPELDGGWFRSFDFRRWEYWGSNADMDWGAWCIEVGWTQAWIATVLALRELNTSLWDVSQKSRAQEHFEGIRRRMLPDTATMPMELWT